MSIIHSANNRYVKLARSLKSRSVREKKGYYLVEGPRLLWEAWQAGVKPEVVLYSPEFLESGRKGQFIEALKADGIKCLAVADDVIKAVSDTVTPQGVLAVLPVKTWNLEQLLVAPSPLIVVADALQDPGNLGTICRTALGAGAAGLVLTKGSVDPYSPKVVRSAMGATFRLPLVTGTEPGRLAADITAAGLKIAVAAADAPTLLWQADLRGALALVVGSENHGPGLELLRRASVRVAIPLLGPVESLNAAVAAAVLLYEAVRQRGLG